MPEGAKVDLGKWPTHVIRDYKSKKKYHKLLDKQVGELTSLQRLHYASNGYSVFVIFQGMDAAGKDGAIRYVMSDVNPQGFQVFSFKQPNMSSPPMTRRTRGWTILGVFKGLAVAYPKPDAKRRRDLHWIRKGLEK